MNVSPNVNLERIEEADLKLQSQLNKCLNEKRRRQYETGYLDELAGLISASASDMCSLSVKPDKCAILQETVNQIRRIKLAEEQCSTNDLQQSEVSSSKPTILANNILGPLLLEALDGFLFMINTDGKIEFVSENIKAFLQYNKESLSNKSIYNIIHHGDHARFSSNYLPMSIGNGFGWSSESNAALSKSRSFNCRFLIKPPEDQEETMEEKQTRVSQYENMQITAILLPFAGEKSSENEMETEVQNRLVCVARRLPANEKNNSSLVEQFTTRLDMTGKILTIDTSGMSSVYSQYLNKELVGRIIQELCHPNDFQKLNQHLKETLQTGSNTSGVYRFRVAQDKYVHVQTKSKRFNYSSMANEQELIVATHSIIRDSEHVVESNSVSSQRSNPSPVSGVIAPSLGNNMNGNSYSFPSNDFSLNDDLLDIFPSSSWDLGGNDSSEVSEVATTLATSLGVPATSTPASANSSANSSSGGGQRTQSLASSAFSPELLSSRGSPPSSQSPAHLSSANSPAPGRGTPFTNSFPFSPIQALTVSRTNSPAPALMKGSVTTASNSEISNLSPVAGLMNESPDPSANAKLRNLLTHGIEADSSVSKASLSDKLDNDVDRRSFTPRTSADSITSQNQNFILRELLNHEDEEMNDADVKIVQNDLHTSVSLGVETCSNDMLQKKPVNNNNMLRKLLNNDDDDNYRRDQEPLIQQLLKTEGKSAVESTSKTGNGGFIVNNDVIPAASKRKSPSTPGEDPMSKRPNTQNTQHAHLAGQNPMLASMLAQTPRTAPTVPTSMANAIVSQLPQERLPKNLEKKLVHTPYTVAPNSTSNSQYNSYTQVQGNTRSLLATSLQQEVVTADSRGHVTLAPQTSNVSVSYPQGSGFLGKMLPGIDGGQVSGLQPSNGNQFALISSQQQNMVNNLFADLSGEPNGNQMHNADPLLSDILDQVWSMEQDMNMENATTDDLALIKLLEEMPDPTPVASPRPVPAQDLHEKMAISAIQRQLMSFEIPNHPNAPTRNSTTHFSQPNSLQIATGQPHMSSNAYSQVAHYQAAAPPAYTASAAAPVQRTRVPVMHAMQNAGMPPTAQQMAQVSSQRQALPQYNLAALNELTPQMRKSFLEQKRQKMFLQAHQKRMMQQNKLSRQQLSDNIQIATNNPFPDNMNELMNNSVAPNVTLQRSASIPESQLSPRYAAMTQMQNSGGPPASPSQLSPGQRQQPFSPLSQQPYPNNYPQARLSPHMSPQPSPNQTWVPRAAQNQANLQQQNPMLNAQLSQGSFTNQVQTRFPNQQQQPRHMVVRSMPSPGSRNSPFSNPPDSPFHPPSPGVAMYQQQQPSPIIQQQSSQPPPPQRLQRAVSMPTRVNSPRTLQAGYGGNDTLLSPQPSPGSFNSPVSNFNAPIQVPSTSGYSPDTFGFDPQSYHVAGVDRNRNNTGAMTSEYVRQELRAMVGARTQQQQQHQGHQQQLMQQIPQNPSQPSSQSLSQADFDALSFSLDLQSDNQPTSPALFSQSLLNVSNDNQPPTNSPRFQAEETRPAEPKKSLLQQLLSEPP